MPPSSKKRWRCDVCAMSMDLGIKDQHLSGKKHHKKEFSAAMRDCSFTCEDCAVTVPLGQMDAHLQSKKHIKTISSWKCEICARDVLLVEKDMHLSSKAHAKALKRTAATVIKPRVGLASLATGLLVQPTEITAALASLEISDTDTSWAGRARVPETFIPQGRIVKFSAPSRPIRTLNKREAPREAAKPRQKTVQKPAVRTRKDKTNRKRKAVKKRGLIDQKIVFTGPPTISTFLPNPKQLRPSPMKVPKINDVWKCDACCESMKLKEKSGHVDGSDHLVKNVISRENGRQELKKRRVGDERDFREDVLNYKRAKFEHSADAAEEGMF